jgi:hypothetical protein
MTTNVWSDASTIIKSYTDAGYTIKGNTQWTAVAPGTASAGSYDLSGGFAVAKRGTESVLLILTDLTSTKAVLPATGTILQSYAQFRDWDNQSTTSIPSWMNVACALTVPTAGTASKTLATKSGSCGADTLASKKLGPFTNVRGATVSNTSTCRYDLLSAAELGDGSAYQTTATATVPGTTSGLCLWARPLSATGISALTIGSPITYISGFNVWPSALGTTVASSGDSGSKSYTVLDGALALVASSAVASIISLAF